MRKVIIYTYACGQGHPQFVQPRLGSLGSSIFQPANSSRR